MEDDATQMNNDLSQKDKSISSLQFEKAALAANVDRLKALEPSEDLYLRVTQFVLTGYRATGVPEHPQIGARQEPITRDSYLGTRGCFGRYVK